VYDLAHNPKVDMVGVFDIDIALARMVAGKYGHRKAVAGRFDAGDVKKRRRYSDDSMPSSRP